MDKAKYSGDLMAVPIVPDPDYHNISFFTIPLDNIAASTSTTIANLGKDLKVPILPDSGTPQTYFPRDVFDVFANMAGVIEDSIVDCSAAEKLDEQGAAVVLGFGNANGPKISVPLSEFVVPIAPTELQKLSAQYKNSTPVCMWGMNAVEANGTGNLGGNSEYILGDTFMRSAYFVFDLDNNQVAMAQAAYNDGSDIVDISDNNIPGVVSTAIGTYTMPLATGWGNLMSTNGSVSSPTSAPTDQVFFGAAPGQAPAPSRMIVGVVTAVCALSGVFMVLL